MPLFNSPRFGVEALTDRKISSFESSYNQQCNHKNTETHTKAYTLVHTRKTKSCKNYVYMAFLSYGILFIMVGSVYSLDQITWTIGPWTGPRNIQLDQMGCIPWTNANVSLTTLPGQFQDVLSPDKLSDHDIVSGTLKIFIPPIKKPRRKAYLYQKGDYESMRKDTLEFAKEKYFNGHSDTRSVQENFDL